MKTKKMFLLFLFSASGMAIAYLVLFSLTRSWFYPELFPDLLLFDNWKEIFLINPDILIGFGLSIITGLFVAFVATLTGFISSQHLARRSNRRNRTILAYLPFLISPLVFAVLINKFFLFINLSGTIAGVIIAQLFIVYPFAFIFFQSFWTKRITDYENVAATLGASSKQIFRKVHLPLARSWLFVCFFQCFLISWFDYALCNTIGLGKVKTLTVVIFKYIFESNPYYAAIGCLLIIIPPIILLLINTLFVFRKSA